MQLMHLHQQRGLGQVTRHSNVSCNSATGGYGSCLYSEDSSRMMRGISEELTPANGRSSVQSYGKPNREDLSRGRSQNPPTVFKKNGSSPSKIFRTYMPSNSKSPYRQQQSDATSVGLKSPMKQNLTKYCNDKGVQNVHQRLREYQGSQGKTSVSKALF